MVEAQFVNSTRKLVDEDREQEVLEERLERVKPPLPPGRGFGGLHFLLSTPFRYPPLPYGSRFGGRARPGIWYGAESEVTALAETAYYRLVFLDGCPALSPLSVEVSVFHAPVRARRGVDLTAPPFADLEAEISSPTDYSASQRLGDDMREAGIEAFLYRSARDPAGGRDVGLFVPAFGPRGPSVPETWLCTASPARVEFVKKDFFARRSLSFPGAAFLVDGRLPTPGVP
ncbi:RES family NAD+ phosphorylase [Myxococcota bacterium]|nr:RES family NAD+ phosphorylase [Myxococcota bacterium]